MNPDAWAERIARNLNESMRRRGMQNYRRKDGGCICPICHMLDRDPTIVTDVYDALVKITWLS